MNVRVPLLALLLLAPALGTAQEDPSRAELEKALSRERPPMRRHAAKVGGAITIEVEAARDVTVRRDGDREVVVIPIGTTAPIECEIVTGEAWAPTELWRAAHDAARGDARVAASGVDDIASVEGTPLLFVTHLYAVPRGGELAPRLLKQAALVHPARSILCRHDEVGYAATFQRIVREVAEPVIAAAPPRSTRYAELRVLRYDDVPVAWVTTEIADAGGGATLERVRSMILLPRDPELGLQEDRSEVRVDADGRVQSGRAEGRRDGAERYRVTLARGKGWTYRVEGTASGDAVGAELRTREGIASSTLEARRALALLSGAERSLTLEQWEPDEDPVAVQTTVLDRGDGARVACYARGEVRACGPVDAHGFFEERGPARAGDPPLVERRVWSRGTL